MKKDINFRRTTMISRIRAMVLLVSSLGLLMSVSADAQVIDNAAPDRWVTVTEGAAGTDGKARDEAEAMALRKAVERACGVFLTSQSKAENFQTIYDKAMANAVGYVKEHRVVRTWVKDGITFVKVRAKVSTQKFEQSWADIAHTYHQENNPRVIVVIAETTYEMVNEIEEEERLRNVRVSQARATGQTEAASATERSAVTATEGATVSGRVRRSGRLRPQRYTQGGQVTRGHQTDQSAGAQRTEVDAQSASGEDEQYSLKLWKRVATDMKEGGAVQGVIEDHFLSKGIRLVDRNTAVKVNKRDIMLAAAKDDLAEVAALGARFKADVIILGTAASKYGREIQLGNANMHQYSAKLVVRAIRCDSAQLMVSKTFGPTTANTLQKGTGSDKVLAELARESAPKLLSAVVEAWRKQVNVARDVKLYISGMDYGQFQTFRDEVQKLRGCQAVRLREITESVAHIDIDYKFSTQNLADHLADLETIKVEIVEFNPNRIKLKVVE
jgi:hypothetical protein